MNHGKADFVELRKSFEHINFLPHFVSGGKRIVSSRSRQAAVHVAYKLAQKQTPTGEEGIAHRCSLL